MSLFEGTLRLIDPFFTLSTLIDRELYRGAPRGIDADSYDVSKIGFRLIL